MGHRIRGASEGGDDSVGEGRVPPRGTGADIGVVAGALAGAVAAADRGVGVGPVRGTLVADRTVGVGVVGVSTSMLICMKELFNYADLSYKGYG